MKYLVGKRMSEENVYRIYTGRGNIRKPYIPCDTGVQERERVKFPTSSRKG